MTPISAPCTMKIFMIEPGVAPRVRRMAMSACLSVTSITSVETMLNAATATISSRMMNITLFSIWTARKKLAWLRVQSETNRSAPSFAISSRATARAANRSSSFRRTPDTASPIWNSRCASSRCTSASPESYSNMPTSNMPDHGELLQPRQHAGRRHQSLRRDQRHLVAGAARRARAPVPRPERCRIPRATSASRRPALMCEPMSATLSSISGRMPRTTLPRTALRT